MGAETESVRVGNQRFNKQNQEIQRLNPRSPSPVTGHRPPRTSLITHHGWLPSLPLVLHPCDCCEYVRVPSFFNLVAYHSRRKWPHSGLPVTLEETIEVMRRERERERERERLSESRPHSRNQPTYGSSSRPHMSRFVSLEYVGPVRTAPSLEGVYKRSYVSTPLLVHIPPTTHMEMTSSEFGELIDIHCVFLSTIAFHLPITSRTVTATRYFHFPIQPTVPMTHL